MESEEIRSENRGRKRGRGRSTCPDRWDLVGRRVKKDFVGIGVFIGKIVKYKRGGLYRVDYEDGDREDLEYQEVCEILLKEDRSGIGGSAVESAAVKQHELGQLVPKSQDQPVPDAVDGVDQVDDASAVSKLSSADVESDADSSSDSCGSEGTQLPLLVLPPSSGDIGVPEESVSYLFSVYNVLRSFSFGLFLSPFSLDDFVGSLNCMSQNSLLDAVHVSLMRALRRDFEIGSPDGSLSENAPKCLRRLDWNLLDSLTWPAYVVEYLLTMGYTKGPDWKGFHEHVLNSEYFTLPVQTKLKILQILCDNVLESAELRTEINMRLRTEVGTEVDADASLASENGPRRVHPRYAKTSACKDPGAMDNILEPSELKPPQSRSATDPNKVIEPEVNVSGDADDGNGDECRLCSMDGSLLCCDGCPSVYHSRCIGLNKAFLPEGDWFCPECVVNKIGPTCSKIGVGLRGAEVFGIDPHERAFFGTCNYLLVLDTSINAEPSTRYYNQNDVVKVLRVLSSAQHSLLYSHICKGIVQYWDISGGILLSHPAGVESEINSLDEKEDAMGSSTACAQSVKGSKVPTGAVMGDNCLSNATESNMETGALSFQENGCHETGVNGTSLYSACQTDLPYRQRDNFIAGEKSNDPFALVTAELTSQQVRHLGTESAISAGSLVSPIDPDRNHQSSGERSTVLEIATCASREAESSGREDADSLVLQVTNSIPGISQESKHHRYGYVGKSKGAISGGTSYFGTSFKPQTYLNQYILGDVAASASANLARLASESKPSESRSASKSNPKKVDSEKLSLQIKAFAAASTHFLWPSLEKKLLEIPREKCGWCMACKGPATSRKGCLLNAAASNALKGAAKVLGGVRPKIGDGQLASIATYVLHMEESLRGLIVGSLLTLSYRRQWRRQVELASTCRLLKFLLLELEENLNALTLSGGWVKPVDDWSIEFSTAPTSTSVAGPTQKRGPSTRRNKKQSSVSETTPDVSSKSCVNWWRGGKLSKRVFQKGILPHSVVKKAARQGGYKGISGINYNQGSEIPRRSRRLAWRAAVEMSKNASQLALQVRNLDAHIRWSDLIRPDQGPQDGKAPGIEISTFRNAVVHDKKVVEGKTRYALTFGLQKHLPSRIMKNIIEVEQSLDGKERMWFSENHIPLYLIKDYEEKAEKLLPPSTVKPLKCFPKIRRNPLKSCKKGIFSYLMSREDKCPCALCQQDLLLRKAVKCSGCQGYCHEDCTVQSATDMKGEFGFVFTCNRCYKSLSAMLDSYKKIPVVQPSIHGQHQVTLNFKGMQQDGFHHMSKIAQPDGYHRISRVVQQDSIHHVPLPSRNTENRLEMKPSTPNRNLNRKNRYGQCLTNGLIWKKKKAQASEAGAEFRLKNILLKGNADTDSSMGPVCTLCSEPYNPDLMYIRCQSCTHWYHADAVQLKEEQIFNLEGFRCCKCRRKLSPTCPYTKPERMKHRKAASKQGNITKPAAGTAFGKPVVANSPVVHAMTENIVIEDDDPLLFSLENVEPIMEETPEVKPEWNGAAGLFQTSQKLPVRRQGKQENEEPASHEIPLMNNIKEEASSPRVEWEFPPPGEMADFEGGSLANMEFEPQTYFSFTELLATGEERMDGLFDVPADISGNWCNSSVCDDMGTVCRTMSPYNPFETYEMDMGPAPQEFNVATKPAADLIPCQFCAHTEPAPDLCCQNCNILIHSHCSPWDVAPSWDNRWKCGRCRDWR